MLSPFTLTLSPVVTLIHLTIYPLAFLSPSSLSLFYLTITCVPSPSLTLLTLFPGPLYLICLFLSIFYQLVLLLHLCPGFPPLLPRLLYSTSISASYLPPFILSHFLPSSSFFHSLSFCHLTPLGQCSRSILPQAGGQ